MSTVINVQTIDSGGTDRRVVYDVTIEDNNLVQTVHRYSTIVTDENFDEVAGATAAGETVLASLEQSEEDKDIQEDPVGTVELNLILNPEFSTDKKIAKKLIRWMLRERNPRIVLFLEPLIVHLQQNFTAQQIANFLDLTVAQVQQINRRVNAILQDSNTFKNLIADFDTEQEDIE